MTHVDLNPAPVTGLPEEGSHAAFLAADAAYRAALGIKARESLILQRAQARRALAELAEVRALRGEELAMAASLEESGRTGPAAGFQSAAGCCELAERLGQALVTLVANDDGTVYAVPEEVIGGYALRFKGEDVMPGSGITKLASLLVSWGVVQRDYSHTPTPWLSQGPLTLAEIGDDIPTLLPEMVSLEG